MAKEDKTPEAPVEPAVVTVPAGSGIPIGEAPGEVNVEHEKKDGTKVVLKVITH